MSILSNTRRLGLVVLRNTRLPVTLTRRAITTSTVVRDSPVAPLTGRKRNPICFQCHKRGHVASECSFPGRICFRCGSADHLARACVVPESELKCYFCGSPDHTPKEHVHT